HLFYIARDSSGRRCFSEADLNWISFIKRLKETGMRISDIKAYAELRYQGEASIEKRMGLLKKHRSFVIEQKEKWESNLKQLDDKIKTYEDMIHKGSK
ncbi:MAG: MerR family transcriptional regulator, partial [Eubacteriales bacterium]